ncbi:tyrosine-type recombinase/integrase [Pontivivens insulae]|uniref:Tyrosine recombinase XerC n=1 Tax=Pontivivens insulae TaxID=1639689 RepID=A0A2R8A9S8_9RHOB|nr:tyrosine-type recombinase/integrase [Pontivivens insulae]RED12885.1 site-specific recombinase XerD [Pontivivens insulae]SPF28976.1 Tyrosine recombinase XerC [Pontivivens insulae]
MKYIIQPRGPGTAYRFNMRTPSALRGSVDPSTGKKFGAYIKRSLGGTHHLPTAKKLRDVRLAEVREMEADALVGEAIRDRFSVERAAAWAEALRNQRAQGGPERYEPDVQDLIEEEARNAPAERRGTFQRVALSGTPSIADAVARYLHDRRPGNGNGYAPLKKTTANDLKVSVRYLCAFMKGDQDTLFLEDVTSELIAEFRGDFLPEQTSPRAPSGLSLATIEKLIGLLRNLWNWAFERKLTGAAIGNPFDNPKGVRRVSRNTQAKRGIFEATEATKMMTAFPRGDRLGDVFRLSLVTGARSDELAKVLVDDVAEDGSWFKINAGKTENAQRTVPVPAIARELLLTRVRRANEGKETRIFHEFPLRPATGKASSLSQLFTRERRNVLGIETDGRLAFHSLRHTWLTKARQAGVSASDANDLGGWAGERTSSSTYDHGLLLKDLTERQEIISKRLGEDGYLSAF